MKSVILRLLNSRLLVCVEAGEKMLLITRRGVFFLDFSSRSSSQRDSSLCHNKKKEKKKGGQRRLVRTIFESWGHLDEVTPKERLFFFKCVWREDRDEQMNQSPGFLLLLDGRDDQKRVEGGRQKKKSSSNEGLEVSTGNWRVSRTEIHNNLSVQTIIVLQEKQVTKKLSSLVQQRRRRRSGGGGRSGFPGWSCPCCSLSPLKHRRGGRGSRRSEGLVVDESLQHHHQAPRPLAEEAVGVLLQEGEELRSDLGQHWRHVVSGQGVAVVQVHYCILQVTEQRENDEREGQERGTRK